MGFYYKQFNEKSANFATFSRTMQQVIGKSVHICSTIDAKNIPLLLKKLPLNRQSPQIATHQLIRENSGVVF